MASYFYLNDGTNTLYLDDGTTAVNEISLGGNKRNWDIVEFGGANGGYVKGNGNYSPKKFKITRSFRRDTGDVHFWNSARDDFIKFFTKPYYTTVYLYAKDGEDTAWWRTPVVCTEIGEDTFDNFAVPKKTDFILSGYKGVWEAVDATTDTLAIDNDNEHSLEFTNSGTVECAPTFNFTPTGNEEYLTIASAEGFRFLLEGTFTAGVLISFNMSTGLLYIGGAVVPLYSYMTRGSHFKMPSGTSYLYITASGAGSFSYSFYAKKV